MTDEIPESIPAGFINLREARAQAERPISPEAAAAAKLAHNTSILNAAARAGRGAATGYLEQKADKIPLDFRNNPTASIATVNVVGRPKP